MRMYGKSKEERLAARYIPKDARCILEHENGSAAYAYEQAFPTGQTKFYAIAYRGTAHRSEFHYSYRSAEQRDLAIWNFKISVEQQLERRSKAQKERAAGVCEFKVGDIVNTSWGYDQTNVDFYVVTRLSKACVWVRPIHSDSEATGHMSGRCWPRMPIEPYGEETRHVCRGKYFSIDGHSASLTTGDQYYSTYA